MNKGEGKFFTGLLAGGMLAGKKQSGQKKGFFSNLIEGAAGIFLLAVAICLYRSFGLK